jgi:hypothetical protein
MSRPTKQDRESAVHARALRTFDVVAIATLEGRKQCLQDRRFAHIAGAQWETLSEQFANKPKFELNKIARSIRRIFNDMRNHRIDVVFNPKDDDDDGTKRDLADAVMGIYRADAKASNANQARDNGFDEAVTGGIGAWRLCTDYIDDDNNNDESQRIQWKPIYDADSCVYWDPSSKSMDKSDAMCAFVLHPMTWDAYKDKYDDDPASWPKPVTQVQFDWTTSDTVVVCEYYEVEEKKRTVRVLQSLAGEEARYDDEQLDAPVGEGEQTLRMRLEITGWREVRTKKSTKRRVRKWILNGASIIEDCGYTAGPNIPIVMGYGNRAVIDGVERAYGHVRMATDAQRLKNMAMSKIAEIASVSSTKKPIFTPEQVQGHEAIWRDANIEERAYMTINPLTQADGTTAPAGPLGWTEQPEIPPALAALVQTSDADMNDILGNQGGADQLMSNVSGRTVEAIQERLDEQTYLYVDNHAKALQREAEIWLGMAREIYSEEGRSMMAVDENGEPSQLVLKRPNKADDGALYMENDLDDADFDVDVTIGPSSSSKRKSVVTQATSLLSVVQDPQTQQVLTSFILMNMEGEGVGDLNKFARNKLVRLGVVEPTEEEQQQLAQEAQAASQKPPDPQQQLLQAAAMEAAAKAEKAKAEVLETFAETELKRAQTAKVKAEVPGIARDSFAPALALSLRGLRRQ